MSTTELTAAVPDEELTREEQGSTTLDLAVELDVDAQEARNFVIVPPGKLPPNGVYIIAWRAGGRPGLRPPRRLLVATLDGVYDQNSTQAADIPVLAEVPRQPFRDNRCHWVIQHEHNIGESPGVHNGYTILPLAGPWNSSSIDKNERLFAESPRYQLPVWYIRPALTRGIVPPVPHRYEINEAGTDRLWTYPFGIRDSQSGGPRNQIRVLPRENDFLDRQRLYLIRIGDIPAQD